MMKHTLIALGLLAALASPASAACYADYKAKRGNPLKLHYGVVELPDTACGSVDAAAAQIASRIGRDGWVLLNVISIFENSGLEQRKDNAGDYFLRY